MKKTKFWIVLAIAVLIIGALVWYFVPRKIAKTVSVSTLSGETAELQLEVIWRRRLFSPDHLCGWVSLNGQTYYSHEGYQKPDGTWRIFNGGDTGFFEGLRQKFSGDLIYLFSPLAEPGDTFPFQTGHDLTFSYVSGETFRSFMLGSDIPDENGGLKVFFGPAPDAAAAEAIWNEIQAD